MAKFVGCCTQSVIIVISQRTVACLHRQHGRPRVDGANTQRYVLNGKRSGWCSPKNATSDQHLELQEEGEALRAPVRTRIKDKRPPPRGGRASAGNRGPCPSSKLSWATPRGGRRRVMCRWWNCLRRRYPLSSNGARLSRGRREASLGGLSTRRPTGLRKRAGTSPRKEAVQ